MIRVFRGAWRPISVHVVLGYVTRSYRRAVASGEIRGGSAEPSASRRTVGSSRRLLPRRTARGRARAPARARRLASAWSALVALAAVPPLPSATAGSARVALRAGGLAVSNTSVTTARQDPPELDLRVDVVDARGSGEGWSVSLGGYSAGSSTSSSFIVTDADVACSPGSSCTLPVNNVAYPSAVTFTGTRTKVFGAEAGTGLGAQSIDIHLAALPGAPPTISLSVAILDQP